MIVRTDLESLRCVAVGDLFVFLRDPRPLDVPRVGIVWTRALSDLELVGVARIHRLHEPDLELSAAWQSFPGKQDLVVPATDDPGPAGGGSEILGARRAT